MHNASKLTQAIHVALFLGLGSTGAISAPTFSAEVAEEGLEKIHITGSRITRTDIETASPITIIDASAIASSGALTVESLLQQLTVSGGAMINPGINNGSGGNTRVNLRGLGADRTLILLNGRRMIASGTGAAASVDLNTIPVAMIARIEVLKDGASAVYGTDAVAGVVNVILKRDFEGFEINVQSGISGQSDAKESSIDFALGNSFDKGNFVFGLQYTNRDDASQKNRDYSNCPIDEKGDPGSIELYCSGSPYSVGGHVWGDRNHQIPKTGIDPDTGDPIYAIGDSGYYGHYVQSTATDAVAGDTMFEYLDENISEADVSGLGGTYHNFGDTDQYNFAETSYLSTPMERINLSFSGTYDLADNIDFFSEATYTKRWSEQQMAPQPIWNAQSWIYMPKSAGSLEDGYFMTDDLLPFAQPGEKLDYGRRMSDTGSRYFTQTVDTVRIVAGLEGILANDWAWNIAYNKGRNDSVNTLANLHNIGSINSAVLAGSFDPFTQSSWQGDSITPYTYTEVNAGGSEMDIISASLNGDIVRLPAGDLGFATGYEHRKESAYFTPDSLTAQGLANDPRVESTAGSYTVDEAYLELAIPLLANVTIAKSLELSTAIRYFDYSTFGNDNTWKLGLTWKINDNIMLRGVRSTAYRAPTVEELYGGKSPSFDQISHAATTQTQAEVTVGGNPLLTPEEADTTTVGVVYEPSFVDGLSLTIDYYDIAISNAIDTVDSNYVANQCLDSMGAKINTTTALCQSADIAIDGTGLISFNNGFQNIGGQSTSGYDINIAYNFEAVGLSWKATLDTSIVDKFEKSDQDGVVTDFSGLITGGEGSYAKLKTNFNLSVVAESWKAGYELRYIDEMDSFSCLAAPSECYAPIVESIIYHDVTASYYLSNTVTLSGGINNLLDEEPPYYTGYNDSNTDPYTYDVLGRYFFIKASITF
ncbi:TonB-dependent receptor [Colwellia sp. E2M01]|uniref:TonB-dependent receptor domain-containing protein n=1 Tax=Colwellia sp. E2M01 TaxID=2841561 RepID=UPI001C0A39E3|nr:TonB-dependent receptor [Colwellia sp. E2M01]MBU2871320.1 TonB-dependent receptor [Colwellia sp. E2M01]